jgi:glycosyltransferase involved in cell wall biosynthesis
MKISIVIPVYNEAEHLGACLRAIAAQTVQPFEVIVVDNNSTDGTVAVAEGFPFVRLLHERRQGVVYARDRGFDAARGDVIGRLDADSLVAPDWVASIKRLFAEDENLGAVTGKVRYYDMSASWLLDAIDLRLRRRLARLLDREVAAQGANMALRRSAWRAVRTELCRRGGMHEDHDLAIHLTEAGHHVAFDERLEAAIDCRRIEASWTEFCEYAWLSPKTYALHDLKSRRHMYPVVAFVIACYPLLRLLRRGYDSRTARFSWRQLLSPVGPARVNPATYVD